MIHEHSSLRRKIKMNIRKALFSGLAVTAALLAADGFAAEMKDMPSMAASPAAAKPAPCLNRVVTSRNMIPFLGWSGIVRIVSLKFMCLPFARFARFRLLRQHPPSHGV